jgi:hypothetical protein
MSVYEVLYLDLHLSFARDIVAQIRRGMAFDQCLISDNLNFPKESSIEEKVIASRPTGRGLSARNEG